jgi:hypothetical protein
MHEKNSNKCVGRSILSENKGTKIKHKIKNTRAEHYHSSAFMRTWKLTILFYADSQALHSIICGSGGPIYFMRNRGTSIQLYADPKAQYSILCGVGDYN